MESIYIASIMVKHENARDCVFAHQVISTPNSSKSPGNFHSWALSLKDSPEIQEWLETCRIDAENDTATCHMRLTSFNVSAQHLDASGAVVDWVNF